MLSLYLHLQILLSKVFPKELSIWFVTLVAGLRIISPHPRHSEQVIPLFQACYSVSPRNLVNDLLNRAGELPVVLIFDICNWNCCLWLAVFTVLRSGKHCRYGFKISWKHRRLAFIFSLLGWFSSVKRQN